MAVKFFDTLWFIKQKNVDPLDDPDMVKKIVEQIMGRALDVEPSTLTVGLKKFRGELIQVIEALQLGQFESQHVQALLNGYLQGSIGKREIAEFEPGVFQLAFVPIIVDEAFVLSELAYIWYILLFERERSRIKICEQPECACVFIDESKSRSKRHCSPNCGNVMKVRRFRAKHG